MQIAPVFGKGPFFILALVVSSMIALVASVNLFYIL